MTEPKNLTFADLAPDQFPTQAPAADPEPKPEQPDAWRPSPVACNIIFAGQRSYEVQRRGYHPLTAKHPAKMLPDLAAILLATYVAPMAEALGRPPVVLDGMAGVGTTLVEAIKLGIFAVGVELESTWAGVAAENCRIFELQNPGRGAVIQGDARDLPDLLRMAVEAGLISPWYGPLPDGKDAWGWKEYQRQTVDGGMFSPPYGASRLTPLPSGDAAFSNGEHLSQNNQRYTADAGVVSPPYADQLNQGGGPDPHPERFTGGQETAAALRQGYDAALTSPPYGAALDHHRPDYQGEQRQRRLERAGYDTSKHEVVGGGGAVYNRSLGYDAGIVSPPYGPALDGGGGGKHWGYENKAGERVNDKGVKRMQGGYADVGLVSPPYGPAVTGGGIAVKGWHNDPAFANRLYKPENHSPVEDGAWARYREGKGPSPGWAGYEARRYAADNASPQVEAAMTSPPYGPALGEGDHGRGTDKSRNGLADQPSPGGASRIGAGYADAGITSPPYGEIRQDGGNHQFGDHGAMTNYSGEERVKRTRRKADNLGNVPYGTMESALAYLEHLTTGGQQFKTGTDQHDEAKARGWAHYLAQMVPVYLGYHQVIRPGGVLIVVVRNFRRDRGEVDLVGDTIRLCQATGFKLHATIPCLLSAVRMGEDGEPEVIPRVSPFKRVNANRRAQEEGVPQVLEVYEMALVFKR